MNYTGTKKYRSRAAIFLFAVIMLLTTVVSVIYTVAAGHEEDTEGNVVKVAYVITDHFQEGEKGERKYGYGYEYLQNISYYTGWRYEYVYGSYEESVQKLMNGEVDLMANLSYTEELAKYIDYSNEEQGEKNFYVYVKIGQTRINGNNMGSFNGTKIAVTADLFSTDLAKVWAQRNDIDCEFVEYTDLNKRFEDLDAGVVDAVVASEIYSRPDLMSLVLIGKEPYYFGVAQSRPDLLEQLNTAMRKIHTLNPFYNDNLRTKYITRTPVVISGLTESEEEWLAEKNVITVGFLNDYMPYSGINEKTNKVEGLLIDLMDNIKENYSMDYETMAFETFDEMRQALYDGKIDVAFPFYGDFNSIEKGNLMVSTAITNSTMVLFSNSGYNEDKAVKKLAITYIDPFQEGYYKIYYPDARIVECDSIKDCLEAVANGEADYTIVETAKVDEYDEINSRRSIQKLDLQEFIDIDFAVRRSDKELLSILNKGIVICDDSMITNSLIRNSQKHGVFTIEDFLKAHVLGVIICLIVIFVIVIGILIFHYLSVLNSQKKIAEAYKQIKSVRHEAAHDDLTGLLNRGTFHEMCIDLKKSKEPIALLMMDVDKFKEVNDNYGHQTGDKALKKVANTLKNSFRKNDYIIRYAGDEFVVIMPGMTYDDRDRIISIVKKVNNLLQIHTDDLPAISLSVGIAFSECGYNDEIFEQADTALYKTKKAGRCGCSVYEAIS